MIRTAGTCGRSSRNPWPGPSACQRASAGGVRVSAATEAPRRAVTAGRPSSRAIRSTMAGSIASWRTTMSGFEGCEDGRDPLRPMMTAAPDVVGGEGQPHPGASSRTMCGWPWTSARSSRNQSAIAWIATGRPTSSWALVRMGSSAGATQRASSHRGLLFTPGT